MLDVGFVVDGEDLLRDVVLQEEVQAVNQGFHLVKFANLNLIQEMKIGRGKSKRVGEYI